MIYLDSGDRLLIICVCCMFLLVCLLIMVCKLAPWCWCHKYCPIRAKYDDAEKTLSDGSKPNFYQSNLNQLNDGGGNNLASTKDYFPQYDGDKAATSGRESKRRRMKNALMPHQKHLLTGAFAYSSDESSDTGSIKSSSFGRNSRRGEKGRRWSFLDQLSETGYSSDRSDDPASDASVLDLVRGEIFFSLERAGDKGARVHIQQVTNLSGRMKRRGKVSVKVQCLYARSTIDRLVTLFQKLQLSSDEVENEIKYEAYTRSHDPLTNIPFDEYLDIPFKESDKERYCLRFICQAYDKLAKEIPLCEALLPLQDANWTGTTMIKPLTSPQKEEKGKLHFSISYLPTSQKLSISEISVSGLKLAPLQMANSVVYIKFALLRRGIHSKKRLPEFEARTDISWEESINFDLPREHVNDVSLLINVKQLATYSSELGEHTQELPIGKLVLGPNIGSPRGQNQWRNMIETPRQTVSNWHTLF